MRKLPIIIRKLQSVKFLSFFKLLFASLLVIAVVELLLHMNLFYIEKITVEPYEGLSFMYIDENLIHDSVLYFEGKRIFSVKTRDVSEMVMRSDPFISHVYVSKRLPSELIIRIVERESAAVVREGNINQIEQVCAGPILENDIAIDSSGKKIAQCNENMRACVKLPLFVFSTLDFQVDTILPSEKLKKLFNFVTELKEKNVKVQGFGLVTGDTVVVSFFDSTRGIFSLDDINAGLFDYLEARESLLLEGKAFREIDVRFERPVVRVDKYSEWVVE